MFMREKQKAGASIVEHKKDILAGISFAVITVSDTRTEKDDLSGAEIKSAVKNSGNYVVDYIIVKDDVAAIQNVLRKMLENNKIDAIILNGGSGISKKDVTIEAVKPLFEKDLPGFSALFTQLSFAEIGSAAIMSRAAAGIIVGKAVFLIPGSPRACRLAMERLIIPEVGHIIKHLRD
jgi:molybdopterin adenylyltransferase